MTTGSPPEPDPGSGRPRSRWRPRLPSTGTGRALAGVIALAVVVAGVVVGTVVGGGGPTPLARRVSTAPSTTQTTAPTPTSTSSPPVSAPPAPAPAVLAADDFARVVNGGWGAAVTGGTWSLVKGAASNLSVNGTGGVISIPAGSYLNAEQVLVLPASWARDYVASFDVTFMENINKVNPQNGGVVAYVVARYQNTGATGYYRCGSVWEASTRRLWLRTQTPAGKGRPGDFTIELNTGIDPTADFPRGPPYGPYHVKAEVQGSGPTHFASKVWKVGSAEPASWMLTGSDEGNLGPQAAGPVGVRASNDLQTSPGNYVNLTAHVVFGHLVVAPVSG